MSVADNSSEAVKFRSSKVPCHAKLALQPFCDDNLCL